MSLKKAKAAVADAPPENPVDEIDQLMSEIEELQEEMSGQSAVAAQPAATKAQPKPQAAKPAPAKAAPAKAAPAAKPNLKVVPPPAEPEPQAEVAEDAEVAEVQDAEDALSDFRVGASDEASLEETLGDLKDEEPAPGQSILDQVIHSEEEVHEEVHEEIHEAVAEVEAPMEAQGHETVEQLHEEHEAEHEIVREKESTMKSNDGSLTLTLTGNMTLQLNYEFDGQAVKVGFEDGCLKVELADGTEFKVPMKSHRSKSGSKAA